MATPANSPAQKNRKVDDATHQDQEDIVPSTPDVAKKSSIALDQFVGLLDRKLDEKLDSKLSPMTKSTEALVADLKIFKEPCKELHSLGLQITAVEKDNFRCFGKNIGPATADWFLEAQTKPRRIERNECTHP